LSEKEKKIFINMMEKKLINNKHKVRLKKILFKEEGFLENKLKKWKNRCKEKEDVVRKPLKRKDKIKTKMKTKVSEYLFVKALTDHNYFKKSPKLITAVDILIIQSRIRSAFRLENLKIKRFIKKEQTSIIKLFNETKARVYGFSLNDFTKWCGSLDSKLLLEKIWKGKRFLFKLNCKRTKGKLKVSEDALISLETDQNCMNLSNTLIPHSLFKIIKQLSCELKNEYIRWCNPKHITKTRVALNVFDMKIELPVDDHLKRKKTKRKIESVSIEPLVLKKSRCEVKLRNEPWNWLIRKASVIISKVTGWIKSFLMWEKIRGSNDRMKIFDSSPPISFFKPFNTGIIALQEEFSEAKETPMKYLHDEGIKQMTRQHLGYRIEGSDQAVKKKITKIKVPLPFFIALTNSE
jgi:hypothetical protein